VLITQYPGVRAGEVARFAVAHGGRVARRIGSSAEPSRLLWQTNPQCLFCPVLLSGRQVM
jgi:hypothetical protein